MPLTASVTRKTVRRKLVKRGLPPVSGVANMIVVRSGDEIHSNLHARLDEMKKSFEKVEFFWDHLINDTNFNDSKEYKEYGEVVRGWELREGVKDLIDFKGKMKRLKVLLDHFRPGFDYELTVQEAVEVVS
jgi:hypothetical protein